MNSTQKPALALAKELPAVFKPSKLQVQLLNYCLFQRNTVCHAIKNKICTLKRSLKWKGKDEQKRRGGERYKCLVIISGCPIYLTRTIPSCHKEEENMFSSPRGGNGSWHNNTQDGVKQQQNEMQGVFFQQVIKNALKYGLLQVVTFYFQSAMFLRSLYSKMRGKNIF